MLARDNNMMQVMVEVSKKFIAIVRNRSLVIRRADLPWEVASSFLSEEEHISHRHLTKCSKTGARQHSLIGHAMAGLSASPLGRGGHFE